MYVIKLLAAVFVLIGITGELTGCGKKGDLEPPPAKEETDKKSKKKQS